MSITKCPGHMRSLKLNFSATVLTLGLKAKIFENLRLCQAKFWGELSTRATFDRCVGLLPVKHLPLAEEPEDLPCKIDFRFDFGCYRSSYRSHSGQTQKSNATSGFRRLELRKSLKRKPARLL